MNQNARKVNRLGEQTAVQDYEALRYVGARVDRFASRFPGVKFAAMRYQRGPELQGDGWTFQVRKKLCRGFNERALAGGAPERQFGV